MPDAAEDTDDAIERTAIDAFDAPPPNPQPIRKEEDIPAYRVVGELRIPVSKAFGKMWEQRYDAAMATYESLHLDWDEALRYYNNNQSKELETTKGTFRRGDSTENIIYANVNTIVPAIYSKNPDITVNTDDANDEEFGKTMQSWLRAIIHRRTAPGVHLKPYLTRATMIAELTNFGVIKLNFTDKESSQEKQAVELERIGKELLKAKNAKTLERVYGKLRALEQAMEVFEPFGFGLKNILPQNLIVDPWAEKPDGTDATWMMERVFMPTEFLRARYTDGKEEARLAFKPSHRAIFDTGRKSDDDSWAISYEKINEETVTGHDREERSAYIYETMTECVYVWDKATRRVYLFTAADWTWPMWVWEDPLQLSRFFPYFIVGFALSTSGTVTVGATSYYLDQQDEINQINEHIARMRSAVFDTFLYNSDAIDKATAEELVSVLRGEHKGTTRAFGTKVGVEGDPTKAIVPIQPPAFDYEPLFNKQPLYASVEKVSRITEAFRGQQFKSHLTTDAVQATMMGVQLTVGQKQDVVEEVLSDLGQSIAEISIQRFSKEEVAQVIGAKKAEAWITMDVGTFNAEYPISVVGGSIEKPTSVFKKKEAIEITQAVGQFANAAPGSTLKVLLKVLEKAFTEVVITPEDWDAIDQEIAVMATKGVSTATGGAAPQGQAPAGGPPAGGAPPDASQVPPEVKQQVVNAAQQGASQEELAAMIQQATGGQNNA